MHRSTNPSKKFRTDRRPVGFNVNKLQAVACIAASVAMSIGLIYFGVAAIG